METNVKKDKVTLPGRIPSKVKELGFICFQISEFYCPPLHLTYIIL